MTIRRSLGEKAFDILNIIFMVFLMAITLYPFIYILFGSVSNSTEMVKQQGILILPKGFNMEAYKAVFQNPMIFIGYANTLFYVTVGTFLNLIVTILLAYSLSRKDVYWSKAISLIIVFSMFFSGGLIPSYLLIKWLGLMGKRWSLILPGLVSTFNFIIMRTSFKQIPQSIEESARMDGANDFVILLLIIVPLSLPVISVITLYYAVEHWNSWFSAALYLSKRELYPLQLILREILIINTTTSTDQSVNDATRMFFEEGVKYATIIVATVPILILYPFLQKYFVKGVMIGSIKE